MIYVETIPERCRCGWLRTTEGMGPQLWRLTRPEPACPWSDHHEWTQPGLDTLDEWEVGR